MAYTPDKPIVFISCGQSTEEEITLGKAIENLIDSETSAKGYFAEDVNSTESLSREILSALNNAVGFIAVMHHRGTVQTRHGSHTRASVWIEQELAIIAFLRQAQEVEIPVRLYVQKDVNKHAQLKDIKLEGIREQLRLDGIEFERADEVLADLRNRIQSEEFRLPLRTITTDRPCLVRPSFRMLHAEGYAERGGDIQIVFPAPPRSYQQVGLSVQISGNITNRIDGNGVTDVAVKSNLQGHLGYGRLDGSAVVFDEVRLNNPWVRRPEVLTMSGLRADVEMFADTSPFPSQSLDARVMVWVDREEGFEWLVNEMVTVGQVRRTFIFKTESIQADTSGMPGLESSHQFQAIFRPLFPKAFKDKQYEGLTSSAGTRLMLSIQPGTVPSGFRIFATAKNLSERPDQLPNAVAVNTTINGSGENQIRQPNSPTTWNGDPMIEIDDTLRVVWEVVDRPRDLLPLRFGILVVGPEGAAIPEGAIQIGAGLAPFFPPGPTPRTSNRLATPRFTPGTRPRPIAAKEWPRF